ncbi:Long-chain-fatty-acid--AMP ligase FadD26 [Sesamum angolense]|uniref:Long-chain-fatty-acid--AMP ligase FadD26 n=2 Tax=Sesamum TaxID=4181 RepID=A0AAE1X8S4_9LAMI|nr:Long-chain-fatty-acid--AMP ligase FadD26 [Sesamum angolense]
MAIRRHPSGVSVDVKQNDGHSRSLEFDKMIISGAFPFKYGKTYRSPSANSADAENDIMDLSELEKELFSKVQTIDYYTIVLKIKGLEHLPVGFYYFAEFMDDPETMGNPVAMQRFYSDTNIFLFWSYGNSAKIKGPEVTQLAIDAVKRMGGEVERIVLQRRFKYFPHVESQDIKNGFYNKVETELQGQQNTYYIGGLMAFELTERNSSYAMALVSRHFACDDPLPRFPYVKRLFSVKSECLDKIPQNLDESKGVEFPDLRSSKPETYGELHANAACIAEKLLSNRKPVIKPGDRVILIHVPGLDFIDAFFGCLRARVLPVPVLPPDPLQRGGQALLKIENIAKSCNAVAILSTVGYHSAVRAGFVKNLIQFSSRNGKCSARWPNLPWLHTDSWIKKSKGLPPANMDSNAVPQADELCFLQFTSGSTGDAKGVMITHGGLIHNVKLMRRRYRSTSNTVLVSWLPQYHDMGLIGGIFTALVSGGTAVLFSPMTFIKSPLLWLETINKYRGTHSAGPNFSFELVIRRLELDKNKVRKYDLSSMKFLMIAAEPVRQKTLKRFVELTAPYGLSQYVMAPGYGLAENCVFVSCAYGEGKPILVDWQGRVSCGYVNTSDPDVDVRIVDPQTGEEHKEPGNEGEIWISSPSAGIGYWGRVELSETTFSNKLENHPGRNIYSADVEKTVESSSDILRPGCCAVIGVPEEILSTKGISVPDASDQAKVAEEHGVSLAAVKLIKPRTISKTTSGKIKRFECLKQFTDETLNLVPEPIIAKRTLTRSNTTGTCREGHTPRPKRNTTISLPNPRVSYIEIVEFLKKLISEQAGIHCSKISTTANLTSYGIDSIGVVRAAQKLSDFLGVPVGAVDIFTATSIEDLANFSENLLIKSHPQRYEKLRLLFRSLLMIPAYIAISVYMKLIASNLSLTMLTPWTPYVISLAFAPLAWILCIFATCSCIAVFGNSFLQPNYALIPNTSIWSLDYIKWWALYKAQEVSSKVFAVHLRGTILLNYWFQMFGAKIASSVLLDTIDITDPALVAIGDGAVLAEGVLVQSHEVKNGILSFRPVRIGKYSSVGPYAVIQKGTVLRDGTEVPALQVTEEGKLVPKSDKASHIQKVAELSKDRDDTNHVVYHLMGVYMVGFLSSLSAAIVYCIYIMICQRTPQLNTSCFFASLELSTGFLSRSLHMLMSHEETPQAHLKTWLRHRIIVACHLRFAKLLSGTEAFCIYLRLLGAKVGKYCSIRAINPVLEPTLVSIGAGVHLGDFSRIITGFYSSRGFTSGKIEVQENSVVGSQSLVLPGATIQNQVILGALSSAPINSVLQKGGVYIGSQTPIMIKNTMHELDERIEEMDHKYKKIVGNLAANLAATTLKVRTRYFHRIGVSAKGVLRIYENIEGFPDHKIFQPGKTYPVIVRHSNSLSADDDARIDARGAAVRIFSENSDCQAPLLDLTLKTGKAFYARTISDFATWLVCGLPAREEQVKRAPHIRDAVWMSLRNAETFTELHYYSNICRLFRFKDGQEMFVKFKLRPFDERIHEDSGKVEPTGILPPETGAIPRGSNDKRPLLFLADDFQRRVSSPDGVRYIFQLQFQPVPQDAATQDVVLDCTKPWDESKFPYVDVGEVIINQNLTKEQSEELEFNPFLRCHEIDVIRATSASQSASIDHGRSLVYEICQHLRNNEPLPEAWRTFIEQSDVKVDLSGCPVAAMLQKGNPNSSSSNKVTLARNWYQTSCTGLCNSKMGSCREKERWRKCTYVEQINLHGHNLASIQDISGGLFHGNDKRVNVFAVWMKLMGSEIEVSGGVYVDSMGAVLNPEMVEIERGGCVGREALLFGHIYEGEDGKVKFGKIRIEEGGFVGSRSVAMPGVVVEDGGSLGALSLAMKEEIVRTKSHN